MKITNKLDLPTAFTNYATGDDSHAPVPNRYSCTEILGSTREIILNRRHYDDIEVDVADMVPALFGTAVHQVLEQNAPVLESDILTECSVEAQFGDNTLTGRIDLLNLQTLSIEDYKTCSVSKVMHEDFDDWYKQGMEYAYLVFKTRGIILKHLKFYALMKDWSKLKSAVTSNYPSSPIYVWSYDIQDSDYDYIERFIKNKLAELSKYAEEEPPMCSDEERWYTGTKYAVYKKAGDARAAYVADTEDDAHNYISNKCNGAGEIEVRKGEYLKCKYYCNCSKFCKKGE